MNELKTGSVSKKCVVSSLINTFFFVISAYHGRHLTH